MILPTRKLATMATTSHTMRRYLSCTPMSSNAVRGITSNNRLPEASVAPPAVRSPIARTAISRRTVHVEHHPRPDASNGKDSSGEPNTAATRTAAPKPRSRRSRTTRKRASSSFQDKTVLSYKEFVHRFAVLSLYRGYLRCIRDSMPHNQDDLAEQVKREFRIHSTESDAFTARRFLSEGQKQFEELKEFTGQSNKYEGESWINTKDAEDPRGRVGTGWPWAKQSETK
ncbi:unnamed protein product [Pseudo-nitzschia multistriata]|uniref:Complex 1 LYR protein domain-containing protein n=1 Tax=Pseudo-nitzschia multistriata TaxID=183589 RepID=A0A448YZC1_9STRA|nr:unnamed protein product [Pseudo-nitzschia multistriata]